VNDKMKYPTDSNMLGILNIRKVSTIGAPVRAPLLSTMVTTQQITAIGMLIYQMKHSKYHGKGMPGVGQVPWLFSMPRGGRVAGFDIAHGAVMLAA
jgi:hypothetical protein